MTPDPGLGCRHQAAPITEPRATSRRIGRRPKADAVSFKITPPRGRNTKPPAAAPIGYLRTGAGWALITESHQLALERLRGVAVANQKHRVQESELNP